MPYHDFHADADFPTLGKAGYGRSSLGPSQPGTQAPSQSGSCHLYSERGARELPLSPHSANRWKYSTLRKKAQGIFRVTSGYQAQISSRAALWAAETKIKGHPLGCPFILVRPAGFEPVAYRVGVIRRSNGKSLQANGFVSFGQICEELQKVPGGIAVQCLRGLSSTVVK